MCVSVWGGGGAGVNRIKLNQCQWEFYRDDDEKETMTMNQTRRVSLSPRVCSTESAPPRASL